jgi:hypothetical protein
LGATVRKTIQFLEKILKTFRKEKKILRRIDSGAAGGVDQFVKSIIRYLIIQMY